MTALASDGKRGCPICGTDWLLYRCETPGQWYGQRLCWEHYLAVRDAAEAIKRFEGLEEGDGR